ncbi:MAG: holin, BlyA family protein [Lachnospiraceae bacterium]|nr:holin, BlyA family protein [Lachnospiraceae bacterium]
MEKKTELQTKIPEEEIEEQKKRGFLQNNTGVGVVEIILILVVLIALVLIFKDQLTAIVEKAMSALEKSVDGILS